MVGVFKFPSHFVFGAAAGVALIMGLTGCVAADRGGPTGHVETSAAELGHAYAIEVCASCHAVEPGQLVSPNVAAPSFEALATRPDMTRPALSALFHLRQTVVADMGEALVLAESLADHLARRFDLSLKVTH